METTIKNHLNQILMKHNFQKEDAGFISGVFEDLETKRETEFMKYKEVFLTQKDKVEIIKSIYFAGVVQFAAVIASLMAIIHFMLK